MIKLTIEEVDKENAINEYRNIVGSMMCKTCMIAQALKRNNIEFEFVESSRISDSMQNTLYYLDDCAKDITFLQSDEWKDVKTPFAFGIIPV